MGAYNQITLFPTLHFDAVDRRSLLDCWAVHLGKRFIQKHVQNGTLPAPAGSDDVAQHDVSLHLCLSPLFPSRLGDFKSGSGGARACCPSFVGGTLEAEVGEVFQSGLWLLKGRHTPLRQPALQSNVACFRADGGAREGRFHP